MKQMLYKRPSLHQLTQELEAKEMNDEIMMSWGSGWPTEYKPSLEEQIKREREDMLQSIFPSERGRHARRLAELEKQLFILEDAK